jgi:glutathione S-transferase
MPPIHAKQEAAMLELYHSGSTTCSKQVRQHLVEKGVPYVSRYIELWRYANLEPAYLALNPNGVVPTLVHDGRPIINSFCIMEYIEDVFPERPLRPADPVLRARQRHWSWVADEIHPTIADVTYNQLMRKRLGAMDRATIDGIAAKMPVPERRERFVRTAGKGLSASEQAERWARIATVLDQFEQALAPGPWVCGTEYSLGDVSMLAIVARVAELKPDWMAARGRTKEWLARSLARPAVQKTYATDTEECPPRPSGVFSLNNPPPAAREWEGPIE